MQKLKNGKRAMGKISDLSARRARNQRGDVNIRPGKVADRANGDWQENIGVLGEALGYSRERKLIPRGPFFIVGHPAVKKAADGAIYPVPSANHIPVVVITDEVANFFMRNGSPTIDDAVRRSALLGAAVSAAVIARNKSRNPALRNDSYNAELWSESLGLQMPGVQSMAYRFGASVMNLAGKGINPDNLVAVGKDQSDLAYHVAGFVDPMPERAVADVAAILYSPM